MPETLLSLAALLQRYNDPDNEPPDVTHIRLADAMREGDDPLHVLPYLVQALGKTVHSFDDLLAINDDDTEEELHSFRVAEGVVVVIPSHNQWLLFEHDSP